MGFFQLAPCFCELYFTVSVKNARETIIEPDKASSRARKIVKQGDILYSTVKPYLHNICIVDKEFSCEPIASTGFAVLAVEAGIVNAFLFYYMLSPAFDRYASKPENSRGTTYPAITDNILYKALVPLPPLAEQRRIAERVEAMFAAIDSVDGGGASAEEAELSHDEPLLARPASRRACPSRLAGLPIHWQLTVYGHQSTVDRRLMANIPCPKL